MSNARLAAPPLSIDRLVDKETGIIRSVREVLLPERAPDAYTSLTAEVSDARRLGEWPADRVSLGTTFGDPEGARIAAIAEAVERYCGNFLPNQLEKSQHRIGTAAGLRAEGLNVVDLATLPQYAQWQLSRPGFPYQNLTDNVRTLWSVCLDQDDQESWLPASLVHLNWRQSGFRELDRVHHLNYAGIATGQGVQDAHDRGLLEVLERDALELWWHLDAPAIGIDPGSVPGLSEAMAGCDLEYWLVSMPSRFAPAFAALVYDPLTGLYAAGFSCKTDPAEAARKAVLEAVHTWIYTQGCVEADGWVFQAVAAGLMAKGLFLAHRQDRHYLASVGADFANVVDLGAHVQVWLDPEVSSLALRFTKPALGVKPLASVSATTMPEVHSRLNAAGHRIFRRDLTTPDIAQTSLRVVRTFVSSFIPNAPAAFAYLGCPRFGEVAVQEGWRSKVPEHPSDFTLTPPPHM